MSSARHPIAERVATWADGPTKLLATVMGLPLVDGIFAAIVLADGLRGIAGVLQVGLLVFGGSATVAVVFSEFDTDRLMGVRRVLVVGIPLILVAALEAAIAPTLGSALDLVTFERFAALVILAIAAKTASARIGEWLPRPSAIVLLGFVASVRLGSLEIAFRTDLALVARAAAAAGVGVLFALGVVLARPRLARLLDIDRFRFGSAVALGMLAVSLFLPAYNYAPLAVLLVTTVLAFDPDAVGETSEPAVSADGGETDEEPTDRPPYL